MKIKKKELEKMAEKVRDKIRLVNGRSALWNWDKFWHKITDYQIPYDHREFLDERNQIVTRLNEYFEHEREPIRLFIEWGEGVYLTEDMETVQQTISKRQKKQTDTLTLTRKKLEILSVSRAVSVGGREDCKQFADKITRIQENLWRHVLSLPSLSNEVKQELLENLGMKEPPKIVLRKATSSDLGGI